MNTLPNFSTESIPEVDEVRHVIDITGTTTESFPKESTSEPEDEDSDPSEDE